MFNLDFQGKDSIIIKPRQSFEVGCGDLFILGTKAWKEKKKDYTLELLYILPTIYITYSEENVFLKATEILNVSISKY